MSDVLKKLRGEITTRIKNYEKSDEEHMYAIMTLESKLEDRKEKRIKVQELIGEAYKELEEINKFIEWKEKSEEND